MQPASGKFIRAFSTMARLYLGKRSAAACHALLSDYF
jgi:hypothetical protein